MIDVEELRKSLYGSLQELGLHEAEALLYMTSLALGPATISDLATNLNMARPNVYKVIDQLEKHGLAKFSEREKYARLFMVEPPTKLLEMIREKRDKVTGLDHALVSVMPDLLASYHQGGTPTNVKIFSGQDQFLKIFNRIVEEEKNESLFFGSAHDFIGLVSWAVENRWIAQRLKKNIRMRVLLLPSEEANGFIKTDHEQLRETRLLNGLSPFVVSYQLFANKAILWQPKTPLAVLIEDQFIVQMFRSIFEGFWKINQQP